MGIRVFQKMIFTWWRTHRRALPWRETRDPYRILVSEVMLQQTQVSRVLPKYEEFLFYFPDAYALANASPAHVLRAWKGMGYNRRALFLKRTAEIIIMDYKSIFPDNEMQLIKLPGLGRYTARALLVFAFEKDVAMVDTNIRQIITHFFYNDIYQSEKVIQKTADKLLPPGKSWEWHQALMDYGATELPKVKNMKRKSTPFYGSNRYYRGRIVDRLREGRVKESECGNIKAVDGLIKDGLIELVDGVLQLPL